LLTLTPVWVADTMPGMATHEAGTRRRTRIEHEKLVDLIVRPGEAVEVIGGDRPRSRGVPRAGHRSLVGIRMAPRPARGSLFSRRGTPLAMSSAPIRVADRLR
jgi:hypothetical protein